MGEGSPLQCRAPQLSSSGWQALTNVPLNSKQTCEINFNQRAVIPPPETEAPERRGPSATGGSRVPYSPAWQRRARLPTNQCSHTVHTLNFPHNVAVSQAPCNCMRTASGQFFGAKHGAVPRSMKSNDSSPSTLANDTSRDRTRKAEQPCFRTASERRCCTRRVTRGCLLLCRLCAGRAGPQDEQVHR